MVREPRREDQTIWTAVASVIFLGKTSAPIRRTGVDRNHYATFRS
jgi:hypothetical protein